MYGIGRYSMQLGALLFIVRVMWGIAGILPSLHTCLGRYIASRQRGPHVSSVVLDMCFYCATPEKPRGCFSHSQQLGLG
ncbi:hypothetical protein F4776DRAFT_627173 [Hypoxylon sp. NC0597]|nr:hypothetical protein F4776DRAFT_627173 [Hypoxylon sp. NC0597]